MNVKPCHFVVDMAVVYCWCLLATVVKIQAKPCFSECSSDTNKLHVFVSRPMRAPHRNVSSSAPDQEQVRRMEEAEYLTFLYFSIYIYAHR